MNQFKSKNGYNLTTVAVKLTMVSEFYFNNEHLISSNYQPCNLKFMYHNFYIY